MFKNLTLAAAATTALVLASGTALAAPTFAGGSLAIQAATSTTTNLATTNLFTLAPQSFNLVSGSGDLSGLFATPTVLGPLNLNDATTFDFSDAGIGTFTADAGAVLMLPSAPGVLSFFIGGTYNVGTDFANAGALISADETFSFTQTNGAGNSISISGTFQSPEVPPSPPPPPPGVPEPASMALLGAGLAGLGMVRRRKKS